MHEAEKACTQIDLILDSLVVRIQYKTQNYLRLHCALSIKLYPVIILWKLET